MKIVLYLRRRKKDLRKILDFTRRNLLPRVISDSRFTLRGRVLMTNVTQQKSAFPLGRWMAPSFYSKATDSSRNFINFTISTIFIKFLLFENLEKLTNENLELNRGRKNQEESKKTARKWKRRGRNRPMSAYSTLMYRQRSLFITKIV
jgi:hypothetical protein